MADTTITVSSRASGKSWTFRPGASIALRRDPSADVPLKHEKTSRGGHARLEYDHGVWLLVDESKNGLFVAGVRQKTVKLRTRTVVRLGTSSEGEDLIFEPAGVAAQTPPPDPPNDDRGGPKPPQPPPDSTDLTWIPQIGDSENLRITLDGGAPLAFTSPGPITVGRSPDRHIRLNHESVSRKHGEFRRTPGGWTYVDNASRHGTWREGSRVQGPVLVDDALDLTLGYPAAGVRIRSATRGVPPIPKTSDHGRDSLDSRKTGNWGLSKATWIIGLIVTAIIGPLLVAFLFRDGGPFNPLEPPATKGVIELIQPNSSEPCCSFIVSLQLEGFRGKTVTVTAIVTYAEGQEQERESVGSFTPQNDATEQHIVSVSRDGTRTFLIQFILYGPDGNELSSTDIWGPYP